MAIAGCGGSPSRSIDAMRSSDAMQSGDGLPPDHPGGDGGADGPAIRSDGSAPCFVPTDCPAGLTCCVVLEGSGGVVFCQETALCVADGVSTFVVCATSADCPAATPTCTSFGTAPNGSAFNLCGSP
jgi:hypothetical protein